MFRFFFYGFYCTEDLMLSFYDFSLNFDSLTQKSGKTKMNIYHQVVIWSDKFVCHLAISRLEGSKVGRKQTTNVENPYILYGEFINNFEPENER